MRLAVPFFAMLALVALTATTSDAAAADLGTDADAQIHESFPPEELLFGTDCWAPGDPGENVLPPCDPKIVPPTRAAPVSETAFDDTHVERVPRWWEFWKPGWTIWPE